MEPNDDNDDIGDVLLYRRVAGKSDLAEVDFGSEILLIKEQSTTD